MNRLLVRRLTYPLHEWAKGQRTVAAFHRLQQRSAWSAEQLARFQTNELRRIVSHAYHHIPYYRKRFEERGVLPDDIRNIEDLARLSFTNKAEVREHGEEMIDASPGSRERLFRTSTSGSTGEPVAFYVDRGRIANEWAACWRARSWWGLDWGDPWLWLWGSPIELDTQHLVKRIRDRLLNRRMLSAYYMTDESMERYVRFVRRDRPRYIYAFASAAYLLARFVLKNGIDLSDVAPVTVFVTADMLHRPMRDAITAAFHCPVSVEYGSRDGGFLAHECPDGNLHVHADRVILEIVRGDTPVDHGEVGEIVLTLLDSTGMPFIRFRTGDAGALDDRPCPCGRPYPVLRSLEGRCSDYLMGRGGQLIHPEALSDILEKLGGVARYRALQESLDVLTLEIVPARTGDELPLARIREQVRGLLGEPLNVNVKLVDTIPLTASGKYRFVVSKLTGRYFDKDG